MKSEKFLFSLNFNNDICKIAYLQNLHKNCHSECNEESHNERNVWELEILHFVQNDNFYHYFTILHNSINFNKIRRNHNA
jgi:hypothetical protein